MEERLNTIRARLALMRRARSVATGIVSKAVERTLAGTKCIVHGSSASKMDHPSSDLDLLVVPGDNNRAGSKMLRDWAISKEILNAYSRAFEGDPFCSLCNRVVSKNKICLRSGVSLCQGCFGRFTDKIIRIIAGYSVEVRVRQWAQRHHDRPYRVLTKSLRQHPRISNANAIVATKVPVISMRLRLPRKSVVADAGEDGSAARNEGGTGSNELSPDTKSEHHNRSSGSCTGGVEVAVDLSLCSSRSEAESAKLRLLRLFGPHEIEVVPEMVLMLKDILHRASLDETYSGGIGGYTAVAMILVFLRNTQVLCRGITCAIPSDHLIKKDAKELMDIEGEDGNYVDGKAGSKGRLESADANRVEEAILEAYICRVSETRHIWRARRRTGEVSETDSVLISKRCLGKGRNVYLLMLGFCRFYLNRTHARQSAHEPEHMFFCDVKGGCLRLEDPEDPTVDLGEKVFNFAEVQARLQVVHDELCKELQLPSDNPLSRERDVIQTKPVFEKSVLATKNVARDLNSESSETVAIDRWFHHSRRIHSPPFMVLTKRKKKRTDSVGV